MKGLVCPRELTKVVTTIMVMLLPFPTPATFSTSHTSDRSLVRSLRPWGIVQFPAGNLKQT